MQCSSVYRNGESTTIALIAKAVTLQKGFHGGL
jgi:hypothetical protein